MWPVNRSHFDGKASKAGSPRPRLQARHGKFSCRFRVDGLLPSAFVAAEKFSVLTVCLAGGVVDIATGKVLDVGQQPIADSTASKLCAGNTAADRELATMDRQASMDRSGFERRKGDRRFCCVGDRLVACRTR